MNTSLSAPPTKQIALLEAAARIVAEQGAEALSIRRLAAEVGASTMAVYTWYGSKPNLMRAVFNEAYSRFRSYLLAQGGGPDPLVALIELGRGYRDYAKAEPNLYEVMFGRSYAHFEPEPEDLVLALGTFELLVDAVGNCVDAGLLSCDPEAGAWQIWASVHGAMSLELAGAQTGPVPTEQAEANYQALCRTVLLGLGADAARLEEAQTRSQQVGEPLKSLSNSPNAHSGVTAKRAFSVKNSTP